MAEGIQFDDGEGYEQMMGHWSQLVGAIFLDWLALPPGQKALDVGCGNGAFTELWASRLGPVSIDGIDPSEGQLAYARTRPVSRVARFQQGDAQALPYADDAFDTAIMALVIFFVPVPQKGLAEMVRVVQSGGTVAAYAWDVLGGGLPFEPMVAAFRELGLTPMLPPSAAVSRIDALQALWVDGGLEQVETREITVTRTFASFDEFWAINMRGSSVGPAIAAMPPERQAQLKQRVKDNLGADAQGRVTCTGRANAVKGRVPASL